MKETLARYKTVVDEALTRALTNNTLPQAGTWGEHVNKRLTKLSTQGKGVRASLVLATYNFFESDLPETVTQTAAGLELIHTGLLIHDDIMDEDDTRRSMPASHIHYALSNPDHPRLAKTGESLAICEADIAYFLGVSQLAPEVVSKVAQDIALVGVAQMHDVSNEHQERTAQEILQCYEYKTARYTFSVPMWAASTLAGQSQTADILYDIGKHFGIIYQLRDDELGLFAHPEITGKPLGSDIRQGKQTIYTALLKDHAAEADYAHAQKILQAHSTAEEDITWMCNLITQSGTRQAVHALMQEHAAAAQELIRKAPLRDEHKTFLHEVLDYCSQRQK